MRRGCASAMAGPRLDAERSGSLQTTRRGRKVPRELRSGERSRSAALSEREEVLGEDGVITGITGAPCCL